MGIVDPIPTQAELEQLYNSAEYFAEHMSYDYATLSSEQIDALIKENTAYHLSHLKPFIDVSNKKVLEIGCGGGFLLKGLQNQGAWVTGIETSDASVEFAAKKLNLSLQNADFEAIKFDKKFDLIILNHVLEHFVEVVPVLQKLSDKLVPDGLLYLRVPDFGSYDRKVYKQKWPAFLPFHISYFTESSLRKLLKDNNLQIIYQSRFFSEKFLNQLPHGLRKGILRLCHLMGLEKKFSGRTITLLAKKLS